VPVLADPSELPATFADDGMGTVTVTAHRPGDVELHVRARAPALLLARESWKPGWTATVDGAATPLHRAAWLFFAVPVPAGDHVVRLVYRDASVLVGLVACLSWLVLLAVAGIVERRRRERPPVVSGW
jgi:hypothetical protein